jgi:predicted metal-dependent hydrolase
MVLPPAEALVLAQQLVDAGRPFQAHEVLESAWRAAPSGERELWRGLAQIAVGLTHAQRGNARGAVALLRRGSHGVLGFTGSPPYGLDAAGIARSAGQLAARIDRGGLDIITPADLRLILQGAAG